MQLPQIRLHQTYGKIGLQITQPVQEIQQTPAQIQLQKTPTKLTIEKQDALLEINQDQARGEVNIKINSVFSRDMAQYAKQKGLEAIGEIAEEGRQLAAIEKKGNAIAAIATQKGNPPPEDFNIAFIPSNGSVKINFTPAKLKFDWQIGDVDIQFTPSKLNHQYIPGKTEIYLQQKQGLEIDFIGTNINQES